MSLDGQCSSKSLEYNPTPISQLKKLKDVEYRPTKKVKQHHETSDTTKMLKTKDTDVKPSRVKETSTTSSPIAKEDVKVKPTEDAVEIIITDEPLFDEDPVNTVLSSLTETKKRVAHSSPSSSSTSSSSSGNTSKTKASVQKKNAKEVMMERFKALSSPQTQTKIQTQIQTDSQGKEPDKKRVAHKLNLPTSSSSLTTPSKEGTKESPKKKAVTRPKFPLDFVTSGSSKVPLVIRQQYLSKMIDECLKYLDGEEDPSIAYDKGLKEEKSVFDRSKNKQMYCMLVANHIISMRKEMKNKSSSNCSGSSSPTKTSDGNNIVSHETILNGPQADNFTVFRKEKVNVDQVPDELLYDVLEKYVMSSEKLKEHGYPLPDPKDPKKAVIPIDSRVLNDFKSKSRVCSRCLKTFYVKDNGAPIKKEACVYHSGRLWTSKVHGSIVKQYSCCKNDPSSLGCCCADSHIVDGSGHPDYLTGFVSSKKSISKKEKKMFALDCEMCNTSIGMELTRITVVDTKCRTVFDSLVKPKNPILDYNTKFSGIKEGDLEGVTRDLQSVQRKLLRMIDSETILIGHSLESDFKALKLFHPKVIDTTDVFPHRKGLPLKRALRTIVAEVMLKIIQDDDVKGHDSTEDAISCMKLMLNKASFELNKRKNKDPSSLLCKSTTLDMKSEVLNTSPSTRKSSSMKLSSS